MIIHCYQSDIYDLLLVIRIRTVFKINGDFGRIKNIFLVPVRDPAVGLDWFFLAG